MLTRFVYYHEQERASERISMQQENRERVVVERESSLVKLWEPMVSLTCARVVKPPPVGLPTSKTLQSIYTQTLI